jgi:hypothetical protein
MLSSILLKGPCDERCESFIVLKLTEAVSHIEAENFGSNSLFSCTEGIVSDLDSNCESKTCRKANMTKKKCLKIYYRGLETSPAA